MNSADERRLVIGIKAGMLTIPHRTILCASCATGVSSDKSNSSARVRRRHVNVSSADSYGYLDGTCHRLRLHARRARGSIGAVRGSCASGAASRAAHLLIRVASSMRRRLKRR